MASISEYFTKDGKQRRRVHYRDPERKQRPKSGFARKKDAENWLISLQSHMPAGSYIPPRAGVATVGEVYADWLSILQVKPSTKYTRETTRRKHVQPRWEDVRVGDVQSRAVEKWVTDMQTNKVGLTTIENALGVLRMVMGHAMKNNMVGVNVVAEI